MDDYFINAQVPRHHQLGIAKTFLSALLRNWFDLRVRRGQGFADWPALREVLKGGYKEKHQQRKARRKVLTLIYTGSVTNYNEEFLILALKIPGANELDFVDDYIKGLPPVIRYKTDRAEPIILEEAMEKVLDNELWLQDVNSRKGHWSRRNRHMPAALDPIDPTGPAQMELYGFGAPWRPTRVPSLREGEAGLVDKVTAQVHQCCLAEVLAQAEGGARNLRPSVDRLSPITVDLQHTKRDQRGLPG
uniref:Retrotransposon gag domain-containing protein n=1 Tax=Chromera velia CCMP2878 TaxID=1169474 RepID=A0A0G4GL35_9ALVE|eukprot:Cvel_22393.t1-p1 / transcript=Cvel_22393.t1 / gene=Cvel_22393 / organism=Chromera_velia_CCMP2878 / gene_product=hypothetical protein / transcript_product=hypothetical protein / location=Cvel_scaffold2196:22455-23436(-) / protein_length=246 / sequence_SO=supercontig / SO=protein_coding / is_pseudo=false